MIFIQERTIDGHQVIWDGRTVWINDPAGTNRARYNGRLGHMDVHHDLEMQARLGRQCASCGTADWETFTAAVKNHLGIELPDDMRPTRTPRRNEHS